MTVRDYVCLIGVSGKAKNMVVKQYEDKAVIPSAIPNHASGKPELSTGREPTCAHKLD